MATDSMQNRCHMAGWAGGGSCATREALRQIAAVQLSCIRQAEHASHVRLAHSYGGRSSKVMPVSRLPSRADGDVGGASDSACNVNDLPCHFDHPNTDLRSELAGPAGRH